jgi:hypothetical protein
MSELVTIELTDAERRLMYLAINEYSGLAKYGKPLLAPLFGASTIDEFDATLHQLRSEVENSDPLSDLDWALSRSQVSSASAEVIPGCSGAVVGRAGLEPATDGLATRRSGQFRLLPVFCCATA